MLKKLTLIASDFIAFYGALALVLLARYGTAAWQGQWEIHRAPFSVLLVAWLFALYIANLYDTRIMRNDRDFFTRLVQGISVASIASVLFFYLIPYFGIAPKLNLFLFLVLCALLLAGTRFLYNRIIAAGSKERLLIIGVNDESRALADLIARNPQLGYVVLGILPLDDPPAIENTISTHHINRVVISLEAYQNTRIINLLYRSLSRGVTFQSFATFYEQITGKVPLNAIDQVWFLNNLSSDSAHGYDVLKRILDIVAGLILGVFSLPLYPFIVTALLFDEGRGIFSVQERVGYRNRIIRVYKFRTMLIADDKGAWGKVENHVTKIGNILRKTRLDELPQLWNVLAGSLSLVGPRPEFSAAVESYKRGVPHYDIRHLVKPGLSGWAQIHHQEHPHHALDTKETQNKLQYDLYYLKHRSVVLDLEILLKTVNISLRSAGR